MKLLLNAPAVAELIKLDPEATVALAKGAAAQIAQEIAKRCTREAFDQQVQNFINGDLIEDSWCKKHIAPQHRKMLLETMQAMANDFIAGITNGALNREISTIIAASWSERAKTIDDYLTKRADEILKERFAAMFKS